MAPSRKFTGYQLLSFAAGLAALVSAFGTGLMWGVSSHDEPKPIALRTALLTTARLGDTATIPSSGKIFDYSYQCGPLNDQANSELCAQWRSALAAEESAFWAKWGFWLGLIGSSLLLWQIILTRAALKDTGNATRAMERQNDLTALTQRAWLSVKPELGGRIKREPTHLGVDGFYINCVGTVMNHGGLPAFCIGMHAEIYIAKSGDSAQGKLRDYCASVSNRIGPYGDTVFPGEPTHVQHCLFLPQHEIECAIKAAKAQQSPISIHIHGCLNYITDHVDGVRQTKFSFNVGENRDGSAFAIDFADAAWHQKSIVLFSPGIWEAT